MAQTLSSVANPKRVGTISLTAIVVSAMIGGGIFNLTQNMAEHAGICAQLIAWMITAVGMWILATTFRILAAEKPEMKDGVYTYARQGFGRVAGFFIAYGYWIYNTFSVVAYGILIMTTLNSFFPGVFGSGNNWISVVGASCISWLVFLLCTRGVSKNAFINLVGTIAKLIPIFIFLIVMCIGFKLPFFIENIQSELMHSGNLNFDWMRLFEQAGSSLLVTLWTFLGIEGAVVISANAKSQKDVSRATIIGFLITLFLYILVSLLPFGFYTQDALALMPNPAMGSLMLLQVGVFGQVFVNIGLIVSVLFAWLVWLIMLTQMPMYAAKDGLFPKKFSQKNTHGSPTFALFVSACIAQVLFLLVPFLQGEPWTILISITGVMAMPCYLLCTAFLWKCSLKKSSWKNIHYKRPFALAIGILGTLFSIYLVWSGGTVYLMLSCVVYACGIPLLLYSVCANKKTEGPKFSRIEKAVMIGIAITGCIGILVSTSSGLFGL